MYYKTSVYLNEVPESHAQIQPILNRCQNAEQMAKEDHHDFNCIIALTHLDKSVILLVLKTDEWVEESLLKKQVDRFMQALLGYNETVPCKIEEILASVAHYLLRDRPLDCGEIPFPTVNMKIALENNPNDGLYIEEQYFDIDFPENRLWYNAKPLDNDVDVFNELRRIREEPTQKLQRCFPVHYALMAGKREEAEVATNLLINGLLKNQRVKSRRIIQIAIRNKDVHLRRLDTILDSTMDSICVFRFDTIFDMSAEDTQDFLRSVAIRLLPRFMELQFFFILDEEHLEMFEYLRNLLVAIPILDIDVNMKTSMVSESSIIAGWLGKAGFRRTDLEDRYHRVTKSDYSDPKVDFQKIYSSHILNSVYPQYSTLFPELRIAGLKSSASYHELKRLFPQDEIRDDVNALIDLQDYLGTVVPTLPPKVHNQFTYAIVGNRGMGHDQLIHHHSAILHDLGFIKDRHIVTIDMIDLISESRMSSVVSLLDKFEEAEGGILVVDLNGPFDDYIEFDPFSSFMTVLLNHEFDFALYFKVTNLEWNSISSCYPSICFVIRQVFELEPLRSMQACELFSYEAERIQIEVKPDVLKLLEKWFRDQQDSPYYLHRITLKQLGHHLMSYRRLWGFKQKLSAENTQKDFVLDVQTTQTLLWEFTQELKSNFEETDR